MSNCKLCDMLPNLLLEQSLTNGESSRVIASKFSIGKSTVAKHRQEKHLDNVSATLSTELQQLDFAGDKGTLSTGAIETDLSGLSHEAILQMFGHDPSKVEITGLLHESHKEYYNRDEGKKLWKHSYRFSVQRKSEAAADLSIDPVALLNSLEVRKSGKTKSAKGIDSTFVLDWADWQMAKLEGGGSAGLMHRLQEAFDLAEERIEELRLTGRSLQELVIIGGGDMVEGCVIYPNQSYEIDDHRRGQIRNTVAMIIKGIKQLAPMFDTVRVVVAPGNHGEHRINGNRTTIGDNDDLLVFEMAALAFETDPNYKHVSFEIAEREISVTTEIQGWTYGITHGDVYGKSGGNGIRNKVFGWFKTMAANRHPVGMSDVIVTHHFHHDAMEDWGATLWIQNPTMDGGSHYYKEASGHDTKPGMNSWVVTKSERLQDKQVLRSTTM